MEKNTWATVFPPKRTAILYYLDIKSVLFFSLLDSDYPVIKNTNTISGHCYNGSDSFLVHNNWNKSHYTRDKFGSLALCTCLPKISSCNGLNFSILLRPIWKRCLVINFPLKLSYILSIFYSLLLPVFKPWSHRSLYKGIRGCRSLWFFGRRGWLIWDFKNVF